MAMPTASESGEAEGGLALESLIAEAVADGQLSAEQGERYSAVAGALEGALQRVLESEAHHLRRVRAYNFELAKQQQSVDHAASTENQSQMSEFQQQLTRPHMERDLTEGRVAKQEVEIENLQKEMAEWQAKYAEIREAESSEHRPAMERDVKAIELLERELRHRKSKLHQIRRQKAQAQEDCEAAIKARMECQTRLRQLHTELQRHGDDQADINNVIGLYRRDLKDLRAELERRQERIREHEHEEARIEARLKRVQEATAAQRFQHQNLAEDQQEHQQRLDEVESDLKKAQHQVRSLEELISDTELSIRAKALELQKAQDTLSRSEKEKQHTMRKLLRHQQDMRSLAEQREDMLMRRAEAERDLEMERERVAAGKQESEALAKRVDLAIYNCFNQEQAGQAQLDEVRLLQGESRALEQELLVMHRKEKDLVGQIGRLNKEHDALGASCTQLVRQLKELEQEKKMRTMECADLEKHAREKLKEKKHYEKLFTAVKNERNRHVNALQQYHQQAAEFREKLKILANEIEILRSEIVAKEKKYVATSLAFKNASTQQAALVIEVNKKQSEYSEKRDVLEQQLAEIERLSAVINGTETVMLTLKTEYEGAVEDRNFTGIQLIDRNDELCILYEKANFQERVLREGEIEIRAREEEIRLHKLRQQELQRQIHLKQQHASAGKERELMREIESLTAQLTEQQNLVDRMSRELEDPSNEGRWRAVKGEDPATDDIYAKMQDLDERLNGKEEELLEKTLVLEEISTLSNRLREKAAAGKEDTLALAQRVNDFQARIRETTRKMMATVSELSMYQATALKLEAENKELKVAAEEASARLAKGAPPTADAAKQWRNYLASVQRVPVVWADEAAHEADWDPAMGPPTRAVPRVSAYIPHHTTGELPIPKPYLFPRMDPLPAPATRSSSHPHPPPP